MSGPNASVPPQGPAWPPPPPGWAPPPPGWAPPPPGWAPPPSGWAPAAAWAGPRFWRRATGTGRAARPEVLAGCAVVGLLAALTLPAAVGLQWALMFVVGAVTVARSARRPLRWPDRVLLAVVVALGSVGAVRTSEPMFVLCLLTALGLAGVLAVGARNWVSVLLTPVVVAVALARAVPWSARGTRLVRRPPVGGGAGRGAWLRGLAVAGLVVWVCGALLMSADGAFAGLMSSLVPDLDLGSLPLRVTLAAVAVALVLALAFAAAVPPRWAALRMRRRPGPVAEWLVPLVALDALLAAFFAVQTAVLFGAYPDALVAGDATPAERAREGFGQLVLTTLIAGVLLAWAARRSDLDAPRHRRLLVAGGGALLVLVLVLVASALRRLWLYEQAFGWTVLRLNVGVFEIWLGLVLVLAGVAWAVRRTAAVPRLVVGSAATVMLALGLAGPDAVVADWNVDRFERTGSFDVRYAAQLSDDAVPALSRLPEPQLSCVLGGREPKVEAWYTINVSRLRAKATLDRVGTRSTPAEGVCESGDLAR